MNKKLLTLGLVAGAAFLLLGKKAKGAGVSRPAVQPTGNMPAVKQNERLTAKTFSVRNTRRSGHVYAPAKPLPDGTIEFVSPKTGFFTRNVYKAPSGQLFAEIR